MAFRKIQGRLHRSKNMTMMMNPQMVRDCLTCDPRVSDAAFKLVVRPKQKMVRRKGETPKGVLAA